MNTMNFIGHQYSNQLMANAEFQPQLTGLSAAAGAERQCESVGLVLGILKCSFSSAENVYAYLHGSIHANATTSSAVAGGANGNGGIPWRAQVFYAGWYH
jgi:hypothetical protein